MSESHDAESEKASPWRTDEGRENIKQKPTSQAQQDLEASGLTNNDLAEAARVATAEEEKKNRPALPVAQHRGRWLILLLLSAAGSLALAWSGEAATKNFRLWGSAGLILLLLWISVLPAARFFPRLPTRSGLAAAILSAAIFIKTLGGRPETFFLVRPAAMAWAVILTLALLWTIAAVFRKLGRRPIAVLAGLFLIYVALGPVMALIGHFSGGPELTWEALNASPAFLARYLPWFLRPMALVLGLALPLAALLSLADQCSALRRPGARHGGNFFLALAWLGLLLSGLLLFPPASEYCPNLMKKMRNLAPVLAGVEPSPAGAAAPPVPGTEEPPDPGTTEESQAPGTEEPPAPWIKEDPPASVPPVQDTPDDRLEELQLRIDDLEGRWRILNDRLNHLERPGEPLNPAPAPPESKAPNDPAAPKKNGREKSGAGRKSHGSAT